jgi:hypothetical protein
MVPIHHGQVVARTLFPVTSPALIAWKVIAVINAFLTPDQFQISH